MTGPVGVSDDYAALRYGVGAFVLRRDAVSVHGPQAEEYLQGQLSQDVSTLDPGGSVPALVLEPDGKLCALVRVTRTGADGYVLDTDAGFGGSVAARLRRFRLRTKVDVDALDWPCIALRGAGVQAPVASSGPPWALAVEWNGTSGMDLLGPGARDLVPPGARWCSESAWHALRVEAGIPQMGTELDGRTIPAEAGLLERAVSFTKGCYTGQELVARLDARGNRVSRRLCGVVVPDVPGAEGAGASRLEGATLFVEGSDKSVGRCTSAAWSPGLHEVVCLAYLHRSVLLPADVLVATSDEASPLHARACALPLHTG